METVKTATGKQFPSDYYSKITTPLRLYINVQNTPLVTVAQVFGDPTETAQLWAGNDYFAGFTKLLSIKPEGNGIRVTLTKE